ncbi:MAG: PrsW family intramembrane metalloprotease [Halobacteriales archaeon]|nr:PrsW family intramembrane metalloprotease [Halobacteriales archaeon]
MRLRSVWRIARWEAAGGAGGIDRRTLAVAAVGVVALGLLLPVAAGAGPAADADLYRVGVAPESPYYEPAMAATSIAVEPPDSRAFDSGRLDVLVRGDELRVQEGRTGRAAASALRSAVERFNDRRMRAEADRAAAFPVRVELRYVERDVGLLVQRGGGDGNGVGEGAVDGGTGGGGDEAAETPRSTPADGGGGFGLGGLSLRGTSLFPDGAAGTPASITPPFPFASLVLAFAFVIPMNFVVQAYASSVLHDRGNRRGEPLLVAPISKWSVIAGKALPYFALMLAIASVTALAVGGGRLSIGATVPIALVFLAGGFLAGVLARSHKELTFVLVAVSVGVTSFVFVPAIFADVHPIAAISPLSLVVRDLEGTAVGAGTVAFSTAPSLLAAVVLYGLGGGLYREEDLFAQVPLPAKALDALAAFVTRPSRAGWASVLAIPFVFLAELLVVALLFVVPLGLALPVLFVLIALIEEVAKSLPAYAGFARGRYPRTPRTALLVGGFSGVGFFLGEKAAAVAQVVGLFELDVGRVAFEIGAGLGGASTPGLLAALLLAPLVLHVVTASITAVGATRSAGWYGVSLGVAVAVHAAYNLGVVAALG